MNLIEQILKNRKTIDVKNDIFAGIVVALVSIPISMGYAQIAGLPVVYGLYGSLLPILIFAFLTTTKQIVVGVDAMPAAMVGGLLTTMGIEAESKEAMALVPTVAFLVAGWFILFYFIKAGRIVKYISTPVMGGFISGVGVTIILMQLPKLWGGSAGTGELLTLIKNIYREFSHFNVMSIALGIGTIVVILICKKLAPKIPIQALMLVMGMLLQLGFRLDQYGVKMLPEVVKGLPKPVLPNFSYFGNYTDEIILQSLSIAAVVMAQTLLASGNYALKYQEKIKPNRELLAYAGMNIAGGLSGSVPINGSVSRSGIADSFRCKSQIMSVTASISMVFILLFGTPYLKYLPVPVLTGIVITALMGIVEVTLLKRLWKTSKNEWLIFMISFFGVLALNTVYGVMIGCVLSFAEVAIRVVAPSTAFVGRIPGQGNFYPLNRNSSARPIKNTVIYRFNGNLFFANIDRFENDIHEAIKEDTKQVVVDARGIDSIDITAVDRLLAFADNMKTRGIHFYITEHAGSLNDLVRTLGGGRLIDEGVMRRTITLALRDAGVYKPYKLEDGEDILPETDFEAVEALAEFEWAFGKDAVSKMESLAGEVAEKLIDNMIEPNTVFESHGVETNWGTIGLFDENEFWDYLEISLEKMTSEGRISEEEVTHLEQLIEERRKKGESRLSELNPKALEILLKHQREIRDHLKEELPEAYAHVHNLRKQMRKKNENQVS